MQQDNDLKHTANATDDIIRSGKKWKMLNQPCQSPALNLIEHEFHLVKRALKAEAYQNKHQLKEQMIQDRKNITKEECTGLVMGVCSSMQLFHGRGR